MLKRLSINFDSSLEADSIDLLLRIVVEADKTKGFILLSNSGEIHFELPHQDGLGDYPDARRINWYLQLHDPQYVIDDIEASDWVQTHEIGHTHQGIHSEVLKVGIRPEYVLVLQQVCGQKVRLLKGQLQVLDPLDVSIYDILVSFQLEHIVLKTMVQNLRSS
jgi:hypothetical protein